MNMVAMEQTIGNDNLIVTAVTGVEHLVSEKNNVTKPNKCNQCDYASSWTGNLRAHLKVHSGEKSNKCNQCDYASSQARSLGVHLNAHIGEKSSKCNQCDYAFSYASNLRTHLKKNIL